MFKQIVLLSTFASGITGLAYQICWQRYLSFLVGSEARSISLVVAIFLCGLATGYNVWGKWTSKISSKKSLLKLYGAIELGIGAFAILFPLYFEFLKSIVYSTPNNFLIDLLITILAIFLPTFLMGGTVPILTSYYPDTEEEVNSGHARIYGLNTLGAFFGIILALLMIPNMGLSLTLNFMGGLNVLIGVVFFLNTQGGVIHKQDDVPQIENQFGEKIIYLLVGVTGAVSLGLEIVLVRALGLAIGMSYLVFPLVLGLFIIGLGWGSLSLEKKKDVDVHFLFKELGKIIIFVCLIYLTIPFWPSWINSWNVRLTRIEENYYFYYIGVFVFIGIILLPMIYSFGRILPLGYSLLKKTGSDYGEKCGNLYFSNTLGTLIGSLFFGYFLFIYLDLNEILKVCLVILGILYFFLIKKEKAIKFSTFIVLGAGLITIFIPMNRTHHELGVFRNRTKSNLINFNGLFTIVPATANKILYYNDGPNNTTSVVESMTEMGIPSRSIITNGKSDGSTDAISDLSTMSLAGIYPYVFSHGDHEKNAAVIGLGMGITAGVLSQTEKVKKVDVLEISKTILEAEPLFHSANYELGKNPKVKFHEIDAFKYFATDTHENSYDIIVSEPSNLWVVGVENLFTPEFYRLVKKSLNENGIFVQWIHMYVCDNEMVYTITNNLSKEFKNINLYFGGGRDLLFIASNKEFNSDYEERLNEKVISNILKRIEVPATQAGIEMLKILDNKMLQFIAKDNEHLVHDFNFPSLAVRSNKAFFLGTDISSFNLLAPEYRRFFGGLPDSKIFDHFSKLPKEIIRKCQKLSAHKYSICININGLDQHIKRYRTTKIPLEKLESYSNLRDFGILEEGRPNLLNSIENKILAQKGVNHQDIILLGEQYLYDYDFNNAQKFIQKLEKMEAPIRIIKSLKGKLKHTQLMHQKIQEWAQR